MFRLFDLIDITTEEINSDLIEHTLKNFPTFNTTELEVAHSGVLTKIKNLDTKSPDFDTEYNCMMAGAIIYYFAYETAKYSGTEHDPDEYDLIYLLKCCGIPENSTFKPLEVIPQIGKKALAGEDNILFTQDTINKYFNMFWRSEENTLRDTLLSRFAEIQSKPVMKM